MGTSGSAKIEGHIKFPEFFDLKPFMTTGLSSQHKNMYCRLFAVIVHAGKNSHSGHYIAYVRNVGKNEWWKMDDSRVARVNLQEVFRAEAYMLLYRVVEHPVAQQLRKKAEAATAAAAAAAAAASAPEQKQEVKQEVKQEAEQKQTPVESTGTAPSPTTVKKDSTTITRGEKPVVTKAEGSVERPARETESQSQPDDFSKESRKRKRGKAEFSNGEDWARAKTNLSPSLISVLREAEEFISQHVEFKPEFRKTLSEEANKGLKFNSSALVPSGE